MLHLLIFLLSQVLSGWLVLFGHPMIILLYRSLKFHSDLLGIGKIARAGCCWNLGWWDGMRTVLVIQFVLFILIDLIWVCLIWLQTILGINCGLLRSTPAIFNRIWRGHLSISSVFSFGLNWFELSLRISILHVAVRKFFIKIIIGCFSVSMTIYLPRLVLWF